MPPWVPCGHWHAPWPPIKGVPPSRAGRAAVEPPPAPLAGRRGELPVGPARHQTSHSPQSLAPTTTHRRAAPPAEPPTAPDQLLQRRPPPATAAHPTAGHLYPQIRCKSTPSASWDLPQPFPGQDPRRARWNWPARAGHRAPGTTLQKNKSFQGPSCKMVTPIVFAISLFLVNCVENHKKIRKMSNHFFSFMVNYPTTFVILA
jgi:hypothetical protein